MMNLTERFNKHAMRWRIRLGSNWFKIKIICRFIFWHSCWCSLFIGAIILALGIVMRFNLMALTNAQLVQSTGLFLMIIGVLLVIISPSFAIYEFINSNKLNHVQTNQNHGRNNAGGSNNINSMDQSAEPRDSRSDLPTYDEIVHTNREPTPSECSKVSQYPELLTVNTLPPAYKDIIRTSSMYSSSSAGTVNESHCSQIFHEVPLTPIATIAPSQQIANNLPNNSHRINENSLTIE